MLPKVFDGHYKLCSNLFSNHGELLRFSEAGKANFSQKMKKCAEKTFILINYVCGTKIDSSQTDIKRPSVLQKTLINLEKSHFKK